LKFKFKNKEDFSKKRIMNLSVVLCVGREGKSGGEKPYLSASRKVLKADCEKALKEST